MVNSIIDSSVVIHQPYFLPWMGYFSKLAFTEKFVALDDVLFSKRKYIDRVQIINPQGEKMWIGLPVGQNMNKLCNSIYFSDKCIIQRIIKNFYSSYSKARYFKVNINKIETILFDSLSKTNILSEINLYIIIELLSLLNIKTPDIIRSSQINSKPDATDRVVDLCNAVKCNNIISGSVGLKVHDLDFIRDNKIELYLQDYFSLHPVYYQTRRQKIGFAKGLSVVDCIFNEGLEFTYELITDSRYKPIKY